MFSVIYLIIFNLYKNIRIWQLENLNQVIQNFKKKRRVELFVESQKGVMDKFIKINKKN